MATPGDSPQQIKETQGRTADVVRMVEPVRRELEAMTQHRMEAFNKAAAESVDLVHRETDTCVDAVDTARWAAMTEHVDYDNEALLGMRATVRDYSRRVAEVIGRFKAPDMTPVYDVIEDVEAMWAEVQMHNNPRDLQRMMSILDDLSQLVQSKEDEIGMKLVKLSDELKAIPFSFCTQDPARTMNVSEYLDAYLARHWDNHMWMQDEMRNMRLKAKGAWENDVRDSYNKTSVAIKQNRGFHEAMRALEESVEALECAVYQPGLDTSVSREPYTDDFQTSTPRHDSSFPGNLPPHLQATPGLNLPQTPHLERSGPRGRPN